VTNITAVVSADQLFVANVHALCIFRADSVSDKLFTTTTEFFYSFHAGSARI